MVNQAKPQNKASTAEERAAARKAIATALDSAKKIRTAMQEAGKEAKKIRSAAREAERKRRLQEREASSKDRKIEKAALISIKADEARQKASKESKLVDSALDISNASLKSVEQHFDRSELSVNRVVGAPALTPEQERKSGINKLGEALKDISSLVQNSENSNKATRVAQRLEKRAAEFITKNSEISLKAVEARKEEILAANAKTEEGKQLNTESIFVKVFRRVKNFFTNLTKTPVNNNNQEVAANNKKQASFSNKSRETNKLIQASKKHSKATPKARSSQISPSQSPSVASGRSQGNNRGR